MKTLTAFFIVLFSLLSTVKASSALEEKQYNAYKILFTQSKTPSSLPIIPSEQKIFVDALEDSLNDGFQFPTNILSSNLSHFDLTERLRLEILKLKFRQSLVMNKDFSNEIQNVFSQMTVTTRFIYILAINEKYLLQAGEYQIVQLAKKHTAYFFLNKKKQRVLSIDKKIVSDLYFKAPSVKGVKIFMFCRKIRLYPCLMIMRDVNGKEVRQSNSTLWSHKVLGLSRENLPSYERSGNTPAGIFMVDSVMEDADQQESFGKFRRMMLDFVPKSENETLLKSFLPKSSWDSDWWAPSPIARDIGRNLFRIHGTGEINPDSEAPYYPFVRTSGCIANRENTYDGVTYKDQRILLDSIMMALKLRPKYKNELKIKGIVYLIEIDETPEAVSLKDLEEFGIR